jgi:hypothetical protein
MLKKLLIISIIVYLGIVLTTSSPFQDNTLFQDKVNTSVNPNIQSVYAQGNDDDDDDDDDDNSKDDDDDNEEDVDNSVDDENIPISNIATSTNDSLLSFSSSVGNTTTPAPLQPDNQLVGYPSPSKDSKNLKNQI